MEKININKTKISELSKEDIQDILNIQKEQNIRVYERMLLMLLTFFLVDL